MANETLTSAFSDIADAIRAKGVTGTMTPLQMPTKIESIPSGGGTKYGVSVDSVLGEVDSNGVLQSPNIPFSFESIDVKSISYNALNGRFTTITSLTTVNLPNLTSVGNTGMKGTFSECTSLTTVNLPNLTNVEISGMTGAFYGCTSLSSVSIDELSSIGDGGMHSAFKGCTSLTTVNLPNLTSVGDRVLG